MSDYFAASGLAWIKGVENFDKYMPKSRFDSLRLACQHTKGFKWVEDNFISWTVAIAGRDERGDRCPDPGEPCKYRMSYSGLDLQRNALRVEMFTPSDRCGKMLKPGRIGGRPDDYHPCPVCGSCGVLA